MNISVLQANIYANTYKETLFPYLQKNDFDILCFQEITGPNAKFGNINSSEDNYDELKELLDEKYTSVLQITERFTNDPNTYFANAIFYKKNFVLKNKHEVFMNKRSTPFAADSKAYEKLSRALLDIELEKNGKIFHVLTTHFAWGGTLYEKPHQTEQGRIMLEYIKSVEEPFIFTGDFNLDPQQPTIKALGNYARNLVVENGITNTLNPRIHSAKHMFPKGGAVDFVFVSRDIEVTQFTIVEEDISDHFALSTQLNI